MGGGLVAEEIEAGLDSLVLGQHSERTLVLVGRTGNGKSATGNSILGEHRFLSKARGTYITKECELQKCRLPNGLTVNVIDTPGLFSASSSTEFTSREIVRCLLLAKDGIDAVLLVFSLRTRLTDEEQSTLRTLKILFGSQIVDYIIIVFTNEDALDDGETLEDYLHDCPEFQEILKECGDRKVSFDNSRNVLETKKGKQVQDLLNYVELISKRKNGKSYMADLSLELRENEAIFLEKQKEIVAMKGFLSKHETSQLEELEKSYKKMLKETEEKVTFHLRESLRELKEQLSKAEARREKLQEKMNKSQKLSADEIRELRQKLNEAMEETADLRAKLDRKGSLVLGQHTERTLVLVGGTGTGKSSTANNILGERKFKSKARGTNTTKECELQKSTLQNGLKVNIIDTPGLFSASFSTEFTSREVVKCLRLAKDGIDAVLLVFSLRTRLREEEQSALRTLKILFGSQIVNYVIVVFTNSDALVAGQTLKDYLKDFPEFQGILKECGQRKLLFDNSPYVSKTKKDKQVQDLLCYVEEISKRNSGKSYMADLSLELRENKDAIEEMERKIVAMKASSKQEKTQLKELEKSNKKLLKETEEKLKESLRELKDQLSEAEARREEAEKRMNQIQNQSTLEVMNLKVQLWKAEARREEAEKLMNQNQNQSANEIRKLKNHLSMAEAERTRDKEKMKQSQDPSVWVLKHKLEEAMEEKAKLQAKLDQKNCTIM